MKNVLTIPDIGLGLKELNLEAERQFIVDPEIFEWIDIYCASVAQISQAQIQPKHAIEILQSPHLPDILSKDVKLSMQKLIENGEKINIRVRTIIDESGEQKGILTIKPNRRSLTENVSGVPNIIFRTRSETLRRLRGWKIRGEYDLPLDFEIANNLIDSIIAINNDSTKIEKRRYTICHLQHEVWYVDVYEGKNVGIIRAEQEVFFQKLSNGNLYLPYGTAGRYIPSRGTSMYDITNDATHPGIELNGKGLQSHPFIQWTQEERERYNQLVEKGYIRK